MYLTLNSVSNVCLCTKQDVVSTFLIQCTQLRVRYLKLPDHVLCALRWFGVDFGSEFFMHTLHKQKSVHAYTDTMYANQSWFMHVSLHRYHDEACLCISP